MDAAGLSFRIGLILAIGWAVAFLILMVVSSIAAGILFTVATAVLIPIVMFTWMFALIASATFAEGALDRWQVGLAGAVAALSFVVLAWTLSYTWVETDAVGRGAYVVAIAVSLAAAVAAVPAWRAA